MNAEYLTLTKPTQLVHREKNERFGKGRKKSYDRRQYAEDIGRGGKEG